jgi:hypothetical protein
MTNETTPEDDLAAAANATAAAQQELWEYRNAALSNAATDTPADAGEIVAAMSAAFQKRAALATAAALATLASDKAKVADAME